MKKIFNAATCCLFLLVVPSECSAASAWATIAPVEGGHGTLVADLESSDNDKASHAYKELSHAVSLGDRGAINDLINSFAAHENHIHSNLTAYELIKDAAGKRNQVVIRALIDTLEQSEIQTWRQNIIGLIQPEVVHGNKAVIDTLIKVLSDSRNYEVCDSAAIALMSLVTRGDDASINALLEPLKSHPSSGSFDMPNLVRALGIAINRGDMKVIDSLLDVFKSHENGFLRREVSEVFNFMSAGQNEKAHVIDSLLNIVKGSYKAVVRCDAIRALSSAARFGNKDVTSALIEIQYDKSDDLNVRRCVDFTLRHVKEPLKRGALRAYGLKSVRKRHPHSRVALGLNIKPGTKRDKRRKEERDKRRKEEKKRRENLSPVKKRAKRACSPEELAARTLVSMKFSK